MTMRHKTHFFSFNFPVFFCVLHVSQDDLIRRMLHSWGYRPTGAGMWHLTEPMEVDAGVQEATADAMLPEIPNDTDEALWLMDWLAHGDDDTPS